MGAYCGGERGRNGKTCVAAAEDEEEPAPAAHPRQQLREHVREQHAEPRLDVLQREVLRVGAAVRAEARRLARGRREQGYDGIETRRDVDVEVIVADLRRQVRGALPDGVRGGSVCC